MEKISWKAKTDFRNLIQKLLFDEKKTFKKLLKLGFVFNKILGWLIFQRDVSK